MNSNASNLVISRAALFVSLGFAVVVSTWGADPPVSDGEYAFVEEIRYRESGAPGFDQYMEERCVLDVYHPVKKSGFSTVVWFHGGGLKGGNKEVPEALRREGIAVVAVNYRLSPKVSCPAYLEDAAAAIAWTFAHIEEFGGDRKKIYLAGHSAGGYLTSMLGLDRRYLLAQEIDANDLAGLFPLSGQTITHSTVRAERGIPRSRTVVDEFAPAYHVRKDAPPMMLTTGGRNEDMAARWEENLYLARMMEVAGHKHTTLYELEGHDHGTMVEPALKLMLRAIRSAERKAETESK